MKKIFILFILAATSIFSQAQNKGKISFVIVNDFLENEKIEIPIQSSTFKVENDIPIITVRAELNNELKQCMVNLEIYLSLTHEGYIDKPKSISELKNYIREFSIGSFEMFEKDSKKSFGLTILYQGTFGKVESITGNMRGRQATKNIIVKLSDFLINNENGKLILSGKFRYILMGETNYSQILTELKDGQIEIIL